MENIAFYFPNKNIKTVDCSDVLNGNPGIGGSEYSMLLVASSLKMNYKDLNIIVYVDEKSLLPSMLKTKPVTGWQDLAQQAKADNIGVLVLIHNESLRENKTLKVFPEQLKLILWTHTFASTRELSYYANILSVKRLVCVGYEQLELYRDHAAFKKSTAIYNGIPAESVKAQVGKAVPFNDRPPHVTYIGSLKPQKAFHLLAKAWKQILAACPDAVLNVIGSGALYDRNARLGQYGIADERYEKIFMPPLLDENGQLLPSVKFLGVLGAEKNAVLQQTRVGVPNPSGKSETFGYTAIEMQICGALVTTIQCPAYIETVYPEAGILYADEKDLAKSVIALLKRTENHAVATTDFILSRFSLDKIAEEWHQLLVEVIENKPNQIAPMRGNQNYRFKKWKEINRKIKNAIPLGYTIIPSIVLFEDFFLNLKGLFKRENVIKHILHKYILKRSL